MKTISLKEWKEKKLAATDITPYICVCMQALEDITQEINTVSIALKSLSEESNMLDEIEKAVHAVGNEKAYTWLSLYQLHGKTMCNLAEAMKKYMETPGADEAKRIDEYKHGLTNRYLEDRESIFMRNLRKHDVFVDGMKYGRKEMLDSFSTAMDVDQS